MNQGLDEHLPVLVFVAHNYPPARLKLATLYDHLGARENVEDAKLNLRAYLEYDSGNAWVWDKLARLCQRTGDVIGRYGPVTMCQSPAVPYWTISQAAIR